MLLYNQEVEIYILRKTDFYLYSEKKSTKQGHTNRYIFNEKLMSSEKTNMKSRSINF